MSLASTSFARWIADPQDERPHTPVGDPSMPWKDTWYISAHDAETDQTVNVHVTQSANRSPSTRVGVSVASGARTATAVLRDDGVTADDTVGNDLCRIELVHLSADARHELRLRGRLPEVEFDLTVTGRHNMVFWDTMFAGFYPAGNSHAEQLIDARGELRWAGAPAAPFDGVGWRDRGWGRRKTEQTFNTSMDLIGAVLPDGSAFSVIALRSTEVAADDPMPIAGWRHDGETLSPLVGGRYYKDAMCWPQSFALDFLDGHVATAETVGRAASVPCAWHDAEPDGPGYAIGLRDFYALMRDEQGRTFTCFSNYGAPHKVDVLRDTRVVYLEQ